MTKFTAYCCCNRETCWSSWQLWTLLLANKR